jgi:hypothetical protein
MKTSLIAALFLSTLAAATPYTPAPPYVAPPPTVGKAVVVNNCAFAVTLWAVGGSVSGPYTLKAKGGSYSETLTWDPKSGGRALKVTCSPDGLYKAAPQTIFAYTLDGSKVWYDASDIYGDAFAGHKVFVSSADKSCPTISWPYGKPPAGSQVKTCTSYKDITYTLCAY